MLTPVKVRAKVIADNSGVALELPTLITEHGVLGPLLDYQLTHEHDRSDSWMQRLVHATYLLMRYMNANAECFSDPKRLFESFGQRLYSGTIGDDGFDPSGLYWLPTSTATTNKMIGALTGLTDWLADQQGTAPMNPLRTADSFERRLNYAAWFRRNQHDFLGHIKDTSVSETVNKARSIRGRRTVVAVHDDAIAFPDPLFTRFFLEGMGGIGDRRVAVRNQLILLMMHFAGCRESDALHLWVQDVLVDPKHADSVIVRLYHPEDGRAPNNWRGRNGKTNRGAYLRETYALTPRNRLSGTGRVGWKTKAVDHKDRYIQLHWFPKEAGVIFAKLWREYLLYLADTDRHHPYAFISFERRNKGQPLTLNAFHDAYTQALRRIGEIPSKVDGRSPHSHRHAMGRRLERAGVDPLIIKKVMHHSSLVSQEPYTAPGIDRVTDALDTVQLHLGGRPEDGAPKPPIPPWEELLRHGFEDIDPDGLFSGANPKLNQGR